jgi:hypothetical protein
MVFCLGVIRSCEPFESRHAAARMHGSDFLALCYYYVDYLREATCLLLYESQGGDVEGITWNESIRISCSAIKF